MKKSCYITLMLLLALITQISFAQNRTITGIVSDKTGPLPGVSILKKGTTSGTETDFNGKYTITAKEGDILVYSYLGYTSVEKKISNSNLINIELVQSGEILDEIVINTGLGISKKEKAIGYAIQKISGEKINEAKETNIVNSLQGRIAGVQIQGSPSSLGGASRITIRGSNSFLGNNQPLFIVDGVPISNAQYASREQQIGKGNGAYDYGNAASEIDPSNIESMSVLKSSAATAIYGSRGANGVILITTKKGKNQKGIGVSFDSSITFDKVRNLIPMQTTYGGGSTDKTTSSGFNEFKQDGVAYLAPNYANDGSWGPKFDRNVLVRHWDSWDPGASNYKETRPWVAPENTYDKFFNTGVTLINTVALSGNNEKSSYRISYTNLDQKGVTPGGSFKRNTISLNNSHNISERLKSSVGLTYVNTKAENRNITGYDSSNPMQGFYQWWQSNLDVTRLKRQQIRTDGKQFTWNPKGITKDSDGNLQSFNSTPKYFDNPNWVRENFLQEDKKNRVYGNTNLSFEISDKLSVSSQFGIDFFQFSIREGIPFGSVSSSKYQEVERKFQETNLEVRLNYKDNFGKDVTFNGFIGANRMRNYAKELLAETTGGLIVDRFFNLSNSADTPFVETDETQRGINSIYSVISLGWRDMVFLDISARNDWSSTLPKENNSYFYPALSLSFALSELNSLKESEVINFAKVRASIAQTGNDSSPYRLSDVYQPDTPNFGSNPLYQVPNSKQNPNLVNELTTEIEFGFLIKLFNNRLNLDATYYDKTTKDQIFNVPVSASTGYVAQLLNAGKMRNYGFEFELNGTPIRTKDFNWDVGINIATLNNKVVELLKDKNGKNIVESINLGGDGSADLRIQEGLPYMAIFGQDYVYNDKGERLVDADGNYQFTSERVYLGSAIADMTGGFSTSFTYKNFTLSALFDFQVGGTIHSSSFRFSKYSGIHPETVSFNGESDVRANKMLLPGVKEDGSANDIRVDPEKYYQRFRNEAAPNVYDASFVKFRDVRLSYMVPSKLLDKTPFTSLKLSAFGRNLGILYSKIPYIDPQIITGSGNEQGLENAQIPATSSFGFNISAKF